MDSFSICRTGIVTSYAVFLLCGCIEIRKNVRYSDTEIDRKVEVVKITKKQFILNKAAIDSRLSLEVFENTRCNNTELITVRRNKYTDKEAKQVAGYNPLAFEFGGGVLIGGAGIASFFWLETEGKKRFNEETNEELKIFSLCLIAASAIPFTLGIIDTVRQRDDVEDAGVFTIREKSVEKTCDSQRLSNAKVTFRLSNGNKIVVSTDKYGVANIDLMNISEDALMNRNPFGHLEVKKGQELPVILSKNEKSIFFEYLKKKEKSYIYVELRKREENCRALMEKTQLSKSQTVIEILASIKTLEIAKKQCGSKEFAKIHIRTEALRKVLKRAHAVEKCKNDIDAEVKKRPVKRFYEVEKHVQNLHILKTTCKSEWKNAHDKVLRKYKRRADILERRTGRFQPALILTGC